MQGLLLAILAYGFWGCFPLFFSLLSHIDPMEVLAQRVAWACFTLLLVITVLRRLPRLGRLLGQPSALRWLLLSAAFIGVNWLVFIWAVAHQRVIEASLGYFITPLVSLLLGHLLLREPLTRLQLAAAALAIAAVGFELVLLGRLPWVTLVLACSFAFYGLIRKRLARDNHAVDSLSGLTVETLLLLPLAIGFLAWQGLAHGQLAFGSSLTTSALLIGSGLVTTIPLLLFAAAAARLDLTVVGFIMYLNPTMQFLTAVFILDESYPPQRLVTFAIIWAAMFLFFLGLWRQWRHSAAKPL